MTNKLMTFAVALAALTRTAAAETVLVEIDCTRDYPTNLYLECGAVRLTNSAAGAYREAGPDPDSRFGYRFDVKNIGKPHLAIVRYPDDKTRCMSVSDGTCYDLSIGIFTGRAMPHGRQTGLAQPLSGTMQEIRQIFWPRWKACSILFGNTTQGEPAAAASVTICELDELPALKTPNAPDDGTRRSLGVSYEDPCSHSSDLGALTFDTWLERMVAFAKFEGANRLTYPIIWYHGPIYPSATEPANYFDWSVAGTNRNLYIRWTSHPEDWVEKLLTRFDREHLEFVSQVTYIRLGSLMEKMNINLEAIQAGQDTINNMRADDKVQSGAGDWTGEYNVRNFERQKLSREQGNEAWTACPLIYGERPDGGGACGPIFNPLHPIVQSALLGSVREIATRYGKHPSYKGLHIFCYGSSTLGFGSLQSGYDDVSVSLFERETGVKVPVDAKLPDRFSKRYAFLTAPEMREKWVAWRCAKITDLIRRMRDELVNVRPDLRLAVTPMGGSDAGIDIAAINREPGVTVTTGLDALGPCSNSVTPDWAECQNVNIFNTWIERWGRHRWWSCAPDDGQARDLAVILGKPAEGICRMGSEYAPDGFWWPGAQLRITPAFSGGVHFMRHYANALARFDPMVISRGGLTRDRGHAELLRPFALAYRALPAKKFETVGDSTEPVTVRTLVDGGKRYLYVVNREYYPSDVVVRLTNTTGKIVDLSTNVKIKTAETWPLKLGPYELKSFALSPEVQIAGFTASPPAETVAQLTRDAETVLANIRAKKAAGEKLPADTDNLFAAIQYTLNQRHLSGLRQLLESASIIECFR